MLPVLKLIMSKTAAPSTLGDAIAAIRESRKFQQWKPYRALYKTSRNEPVVERHYSPTELASAWGLSIETIRSIFRDEPGVLKIGKPRTKYRRGYFTLRIPEEVAERVHRRLSA